MKNGESIGVGATGLAKRASYRFSGDKVLAFGDLHLSAMFQGNHKDYTFECYETMDKILDIALCGILSGGYLWCKRKKNHR